MSIIHIMTSAGPEGAELHKDSESRNHKPVDFCCMAEQRQGSPSASMLGSGAGRSLPPSTVMPAPASPSKMPAASASPSLACRSQSDGLSHGKREAWYVDDLFAHVNTTLLVTLALADPDTRRFAIARRNKRSAAG